MADRTLADELAKDIKGLRDLADRHVLPTTLTEVEGRVIDQWRDIMQALVDVHREADRMPKPAASIGLLSALDRARAVIERNSRD